MIGGGDFANDRIIPDCVRAAVKGEDIIVREESGHLGWFSKISERFLPVQEFYRDILTKEMKCEEE